VTLPVSGRMELLKENLGRNVVLAKRDEQFVAVKVFTNIVDASQIPKKVQNEVVIWQGVSGHPCVASCLDVQFAKGSLLVLSELGSLGDIGTHIRLTGAFPLTKVKFYAAELLLALKHLKECSVLHRDLKNKVSIVVF
jgi:serine/threonine protein kinase